jgi:hypothetical protein
MRRHQAEKLHFQTFPLTSSFPALHFSSTYIFIFTGLPKEVGAIAE